MKRRTLILTAVLVLGLGGSLGIWYFSGTQSCCSQHTRCNNGQKVNLAPGEKPAIPAKACVFKTLFNEESSEGFYHYKTPKKVLGSIDKGLDWMLKAQQSNGGWGAGSHSAQHIRDPHAVSTDPATTSMVAMALLRTNNTLEKGKYASSLKKATIYLLKVVEDCPKNSKLIATSMGTQIQSKLGQNIDAVITAQFFTNLLERTSKKHKLYPRIQICLDICVQKIQASQADNGSIQNAGWAGVLQSSMANAALESAATKGAKVDMNKLEKARKYQESNFDYKTNATSTEDGAGIVLYSVSGSVRGAAKKARSVREAVEDAKAKGKLDKDADVTVDNLKKIGFKEEEALELNTSYNVYQKAKVTAQQDQVMNGFGNNGGEEFISFLQTGESMVVNKDDAWEKWYDNVSGKMLAIQNKDGSWNGHHCITSPVFCTATCLLILSIHNDAEMLISMGGK